MSLSFLDLASANLKRLLTTPKYVICKTWTASDWSNATAGEVGEVCNKIKKLRVGEDVPVEDILNELADVVVYADLLAQFFGEDLGKAVRRKFNIVSDRVGSEVKL